MKDYSELTSRIYVQLNPELSVEFQKMLNDINRLLYMLNELKKNSDINIYGDSIIIESVIVGEQNPKLYYFLKEVLCDE